MLKKKKNTAPSVEAGSITIFSEIKIHLSLPPYAHDTALPPYRISIFLYILSSED